MPMLVMPGMGHLIPLAELAKRLAKDVERLPSVSKGFVERTKDVGLLGPSWPTETKVLAHEATGGLLVHCWWNSVLEIQLVHGVPMVPCPLYDEQRQNIVMLTEGVGVAIRETAAVKEVMFGHGKGVEVRAKVAALQKAANEAFLKGGAATTVLYEVGFEDGSNASSEGKSSYQEEHV
ncbi:hypothetical protein ZWY2020_031427 [Hordeum vulgare]|nr:hypothetical protein ZWY2020_031427 [Hordeum vulgare]